MRQLKKNVFAVGVNDWDRRSFDELIPLPDGTSYNAYLVVGSEKTALVDTVDPVMTEHLINHILETGTTRLDYIVCNHCEQDHSGSIPDILLLHPEAKVVTNPKCKSFLIDHLHIEEDAFITIEDEQELSLGDKTLKFLYTPWVHWPETMATYIKEDRILLSCDFFGSHYATSETFAHCDARAYDDAKRYYAEIMMPFRPSVRKNLEKVCQYEIDMIGTSHGPVWDQPQFIIDAYRDWASDDVKNQVVIPFVSMHESTRLMVDYLVEALMQRNVAVKPFNMSVTDIGELAVSLVDAATVVLGSPTVLTGAHPQVAYAAFLANALRPKTKFASIIGSFGWASQMSKQLTSMIPNLKVELIEPVIVKGMPRDEDVIKLDELADAIAEKHKAAGLM